MNSERHEYVWTDIDRVLDSVRALQAKGYTGHIPEEFVQGSPLIKYITRQIYMLNQKGMPFSEESTRLGWCIQHPENTEIVEYLQTRRSDIEKTMKHLECQVEQYNTKKELYSRFLVHANNVSVHDCCIVVGNANPG